MKRHSLTKRLISMALSLIMLLGCVPISAFALGISPRAVDDRVADYDTLDQWKEYFGLLGENPNNLALSTEFAGGVWTDKSVFSANNIPAQLLSAKYKGKGISLTDTGDNFLVALSAIASNKQITGYSTLPTDTVFILDLSSSMRSKDVSGGSAIDELVDSTNSAIDELLALNHNNRVAVVLYSGNTGGTTGDSNAFSDNDGATRVVMPLDTYTTSNRGVYLDSISVGRNADWGIAVNSGVRNSSNAPVSASVNTQKGTFMQDGIYEAMKVLINEENVTVETGVQAGADRMPIMVLMTDGEPTLANPDYNGTDNRSDLGTSVMYNYDGSTGEYSHRETIAFTTMLTAAFAKKQVREHYNVEPLFYTLGFGDVMNRRSEVLSILDTTRISSTINEMWSDFLAGEDVTVYRTGSRYNYSYTTVSNSSVAAESLSSADKSYVNRYFPAPTSTDLGAAFDKIVGEIIIQSKYYPTYVESDHNHDGYLTFVDKIGRYMDVHSVCGIVVGERLFSGEALASHLTDVTAAIGEKGNLTALGSALIGSVMERMNIPSSSTAYDLVLDAVKHKQLYVDADGYSNYIGWLSDADGSFVEFWHEDMSSDDICAVAGATHIIRSYGFLGNTAVVGGVSDTDMMYMSVRVTTEIATGDTIVTWRLPASLIPTVTYEIDVRVDSFGNVTEVTDVTLEDGTANAPVRLLYEVGVREDISDWNIRDIIGDDPEYYDSVTDTYTLYTNKWDTDPSDTTKNTYSHFVPSVENERYYYTGDTLVYADTQGTVYTGSAPVPDGSVKYYRQYPVYEKLKSGSVRMHYHYEEITSVSLALAEAGVDAGTWVIPKGTVHRYYDFEISEKTAPAGAVPNPTGTMGYSDHPFVVRSAGDYYTYSTQGNNGRLTLVPATGIELFKAMESISLTEGSFTFTITTTTGSLAGAEVVRLDGERRETGREPLTISAGKGKVTLSAWETVYIVGIGAGDYVITEDASDGYTLKSVGVGGIYVTGTQAPVTVTENEIEYVVFENGVQGEGNLVITKELSHAQAGYAIPSNMLAREFEVTVDFGTVLAGERFDYKYGAAAGELAVGADGKSVINIRHGESYEIFGIPEGSVLTVTETTPTAPFTYVKTMTRDHAGAVQDSDREVRIGSGTTSTAVIYNQYQSAPTSYTFDLHIDKTFITDVGFSGTARFEFILQRWDAQDERWSDVQTYGADFSGSEMLRLDVTEPFTEAGEYSYQIIEKIPEDPADRVPGVVYDRSYRTFTIVVADDGQGQLAASLRAEDGTTVSGDIVTAPFLNTHHTAPLYFDIKKNITNKSNSGDITPAGFEFMVTEYSGASLDALTAGSVSSVYSDAAGEARFAKMLTLDDGVNVYFYKYVVTENNDARPGWKYNIENKTYELYFKVVRNSDDTLSIVEIDANGTQTPNPTPAFTNVYAPTPVTVDPAGHVTKRIEGRHMSAADKFTFAVFRDGEYSFYDTTGALLIGENVGEQVVFRDGDGNDLTLTFEKVGTYKLDVVEIEDPNRAYDGLTYSKRVFDLVVEVYDRGDGALGERHYFEDEVTDDITFVNTYEAQDVGVWLTATKKLTGRRMLAGEFDFTLVEVADAQGTAMTGGITRAVENSTPDAQGDARAVFFLRYTEVGTHYYKISETKGPDGNGITYDDSYYIVEVKITDGLAGYLTYTQSIVYASNGKSELVFENVYTPADISLSVLAFKEMEGRVLGDGEFEFVISEYESDFTTKKANGIERIVRNDANGHIYFADIEFTGEDYLGGERERYFVITERYGARGGIIYDNSRYRVTVTAYDDLDGTLSAQLDIKRVTISDDGQDTIESIIPVSSIIFENKYAVTGTSTVTVTGTKELNGDIPDVQKFPFVFELYYTAADGIIHEGATPIATTTQDADGRFSFDILVGPEHISDTAHHFVVREKYAGEFIDHVLYDSRHYHIDILAEDDGEGGVKTTTSINVYGTAVTSLDFDNLLHSSATVDFVIKKTVNNTGSEQITPAGFEFIVKYVEGNADTTLTADESGVISLPLEINEAFVGETVTFLVSEKNTGREHVRYSDKVYTVVIRASLGEGNELLLDITVDGKRVDKIELEFENVYSYSIPEPEPVPDTGDGAQLSMWIVILCVSAGAVLGARTLRRRYMAD